MALHTIEGSSSLFMMNLKTFIIPALFAILSGTGSLRAQQAVLAGSGVATGETGTVSYSVGLPAYHTYSAASGTVYEGVQQPFEVLLIDGIDEEIRMLFKVYPNPTDGKVILSQGKNGVRVLGCRLFTASGILLKEFQAENRETEIPVEHLAPSTYLLTVSEQGRVLATFKIIKR
jgi:hypothetical protein